MEQVGAIQTMKPTKRQIQKNDVPKWEVDFGRDEFGIRRRPYFDTEAEADEAIEAYEDEIKKGGEFWARMAVPERKAIISVLEEIKAAGHTPYCP
jgi:hypothetical protein